MLKLHNLISLQFHLFHELGVIWQVMLLIDLSQLVLIDAEIYLKVIICLNMLILKNGTITFFILSFLHLRHWLQVKRHRPHLHMVLNGHDCFFLRNINLFFLTGIFQKLDCLMHLVHFILFLFWQCVRLMVELCCLSKLFRTAPSHIAYLLIHLVDSLCILAPLLMIQFHVLFVFLCFQDFLASGSMISFHLHCLIYRMEYHHFLQGEPVSEAEDYSVVVEILVG